MSAYSQVLVIGAGAFGAASALELAQLGHHVTVVDPSLDGFASESAASHDLNKIVRADYTDALYRDLGKKATDLWRSHPLYAPYYHEVGIFFRSGRPSSVDVKWIQQGVKHAAEPVGRAYPTKSNPQRHPTARTITSAEESEQVFPASLRPHLGPAYTSFGDRKQVGYFNPQAGWVHAREATFAVLREAQRLGATICSNVTIDKFLMTETHGRPRVCGAVASDGREFHADHVIVAAGSWTPSLLDRCQLPLPPGLLKPSAHCVLTLRIQPEVAQLFRGMPVVFDMHTGMYAFEPSADGILKCAIHGTGASTPTPSSATNAFPSADQHPHVDVMLRELQTMYPLLRLGEPDSVAQIHFTRICWYCDTRDENFLIDFHPDVDGLLVASGDSGHGLKFLPLLGRLVASRLLHIHNDSAIAPDHGLSAHQRRVFSFDHHQQADTRVDASVPIDSMRIGDLPPAKVPSSKL